MQKGSSLAKFKILSGSMLKLIAVVSMLIDHAAVILRSELAVMETPFFAIGGIEITLYYVMRQLGRLAFPIFCFLVVEGFFHTRNIKKYAAQLLVFALISEVPFNLMLRGKFLFSAYQNVYFTLFLGVLLIYIFEHVEGRIKKAILMFAVGAVAFFLRADYGLEGVLAILLLHILKNHPAARALLAFPLFKSKPMALAAFIPISMYNGQRGFIKSGWLKYGFYVFYPLHMAVLVIVKLILR